MLQIRLSKGSSSDIGAGAKSSPSEMVTVACPEHLILADLPVGKGLGNAPQAATATAVKIVGRRFRRQLGNHVHFCVRCDFPISVYGRLSPCEHAFCLTCAMSDSSCYLCDERVQKIQTIKMLEGIYICAAPHCLKSFLKIPDFEEHIYKNHASLLNKSDVSNKDVAAEGDSENLSRPPPATALDALQSKQQTPPDSSSAVRPRRPPIFSPHSFSPTMAAEQPRDLDESDRRLLASEVPAAGPGKPLLFDGERGHYQSESHQFDSNGGSRFSVPPPRNVDSHQRPEISPYPGYPPLPHQPPPNYSGPASIAAQGHIPMPPFGYRPSLPQEGYFPHAFYNPSINLPYVAKPEPDAGFSDSLGGFSPSFPPMPPRNHPRLSGIGLSSRPPPEPSSSVGQGLPEGYRNPLLETNTTANINQVQGRSPFHQGDSGWHVGGGNTVSEALGVGGADFKGVLPALLPPLPPPLPPPPSHLRPGRIPSFGAAAAGEIGREAGIAYGWNSEMDESQPRT